MLFGLGHHHLILNTNPYDSYPLNILCPMKLGVESYTKLLEHLGDPYNNFHHTHYEPFISY
jgi:hypothetical protein